MRYFRKPLLPWDRRCALQIRRLGPAAAAVGISGRVVSAGGSGISNARVVLTDQNGVSRSVTTSAFGYYQFASVESGTIYVLNVSANRFTFAPRVVTLTDALMDFNFVASP